MNFFEAQERARTQTSLLVVLFVAAIVALTALTTILVVIFLYLQSEIEKPINIHEFTLTLNSSGSMDKALLGVWSHFSWTLTGAIALGIMAVVVMAASFKMASLASGGKIVAEMLGGKLIDPSTNDLDERKVLNVVQEMAIASGVPVPSVYLLPEKAINAFAAGDQPHNTVIGVTRGSVSLLSRDELQGVIAHEFSHIFNGDMKLNMKLTGVLFGILVIGQIGEVLVRASVTTKSKNTVESKKLQVLGLGLIVIGYAGYFFGNLIKAVICQQREFLADATSVQYTRDPAGIAGALKKIGGYVYRSDIESPHAHEVSHFFFGAGVRAKFFELDTHPPLAKRILAIEPRWAGDYPIVSIPVLVIQDDWADPKTELKEPFSSRESAVLSAVSAWVTGPESGVRSQTMITSVG
ncbi:MAG: M48 family metallopeptidase, partial [Betaproteobacteria bacterium]